MMDNTSDSHKPERGPQGKAKGIQLEARTIREEVKNPICGCPQEPSDSCREGKESQDSICLVFSGMILIITVAYILWLVHWLNTHPAP